MKTMTAVQDGGHVEQVACAASVATAGHSDPKGNGRVAPSGRGLATLKTRVPRRRQKGAAAVLTDKEKAVLRLLFEDPRRVATPQEVAGLLGMPLRTLRRIERLALRKLRLSALGPVAHGFDGWDDSVWAAARDQSPEADGSRASGVPFPMELIDELVGGSPR